MRTRPGFWTILQWSLAGALLLTALALLIGILYLHRYGVMIGGIVVGPGLAVSLIVNGVVMRRAGASTPATRALVIVEFLLVAAVAVLCVVDQLTYRPDPDEPLDPLLGPWFGLHILSWLVAPILGSTIVAFEVAGVRAHNRVETETPA